MINEILLIGWLVILVSTYVCSVPNPSIYIAVQLVSIVQNGMKNISAQYVVQSLGRMFILYLAVQSPRELTDPLLVVFAMAEIIRYTNWIFRNNTIRWVKQYAPLVFYPMGLYSEIQILHYNGFDILSIVYLVAVAWIYITLLKKVIISRSS